MLNLPMLLGAFRPPKPENRICCDTHLMVMLHDTEKQVAGNANVKRACMAAENVEVAAGHNEMLASSWFSAPGEERRGTAGAGFGG